MSHPLETSSVGNTIESFVILGQERNGKQQWVGADLELRIPPVGRFFLNVVTKGHFANEVLENALSDLGRPESLLGGAEASDTREPFVLNDNVITDEVLQSKFQGRRVEIDLAASLSFMGSLDDGESAA